MKFAFLPNYFKKIGLVCFFAALGTLLSAGVFAVIQADISIHNIPSYSEAYQLGFETGKKLAYSHYWIGQIGNILLLLSMAFYMLAKEKVDDEYMDAIRWESLRLAVIVSIGVAILFIIPHWRLHSEDILLTQFLTYLITFKIKKNK